MAKLVVIVGMHRSGTSYVAQMLQRGGLYLGPDLMDEAAPDNLEGFGESRTAMRLNDRLLRLSGGDYLHPPEQLRSDAEADAALAGFVADLRAHPPAGWKDPRTTLTLPLWKPHLGAEYTLIGCLRHPLNVAHSLRARQQMPLEQGLALWEAYNRRLWDHLQCEPELHLLDFDAPAEELLARSRALRQRLGLADAAGAFNPFLRHHQRTEELPASPLRELYERLREAARRQAAAESAQRAAGGEKETAGPFSHLSRVVLLQNQSLQEVNGRLHAALLGVRDQLGALQEQLRIREVWGKGVQGWIEHLRRECGEAREEAHALRGWVEVRRTQLGEAREEAQALRGWVEVLRGQLAEAQLKIISLEGWVEVLRGQGDATA
jgi:hypothetical protein